MKDIDFDELDRAVGSVLGGDDKAPRSDAPQGSSVSAPASAPTPTPAPSTPSSQPTPTIGSSTAPARRRGQFLDMVHPSANMRTKGSTLPTGPRKSLAPIAPKSPAPSDVTPAPVVDVTEPATPAFTPPAPVSEPVGDPVATPTTEPILDTTPSEIAPDITPSSPAPEAAPSESIWPDPLDLDATTPQDSGDDTRASRPAPSYDEPAQTPFVPDAKVDKRPLGAFASDEDSQDDTSAAIPRADIDTASFDASGSDDTPASHPQESTLPSSAAEVSAPEFSADLNTIESQGVEDEEPGIADSADDPAQFTKDSASSETKVAREDKKPAPAASVAAQTHTGIAHSIPQQYKVDASQHDTAPAHALFDAEEYHQPLLPSGRKKSNRSLLIVLLLVLLLLVGSALGYLAFRMGI